MQYHLQRRSHKPAGKLLTGGGKEKRGGASLYWLDMVRLSKVLRAAPG
ncbi:hypothetical protein [Janthinobacterium sp. ROICE36]|nr:hypothetical protein [Janthinobacterium sp. ROICE36]